MEEGPQQGGGLVTATLRAGDPSRVPVGAPQGASVQAGGAGGPSGSRRVVGEGGRCSRGEASAEEAHACHGGAWGPGDLWGQSRGVKHHGETWNSQSPQSPGRGAHGLGQYSPSTNRSWRSLPEDPTGLRNPSCCYPNVSWGGHHHSADPHVTTGTGNALGHPGLAGLAPGHLWMASPPSHPPTLSSERWAPSTDPTHSKAPTPPPAGTHLPMGDPK